MLELITEEDYSELPEEAAHKWIVLEKTAKARLDRALQSVAVDETREQERLMLHYMSLISALAKKYGVEGVLISSETSTQLAYDKFIMSVVTARAVIWATAPATYEFGRVALPKDVRSAILGLTHQIELDIEKLDVPDYRKVILHKCLENFRQEINQPKTRVGAALNHLSQVAGVVGISIATSVTTLAQFPDAYSTILQLLGAEQANAVNSSGQFIEEERKLLLPAPPKLIEHHQGEG